MSLDSDIPVSTTDYGMSTQEAEKVASCFDPTAHQLQAARYVLEAASRDLKAAVVLLEDAGRKDAAMRAMEALGMVERIETA